MLKVMIVEDDIFDYTHLKDLINWNKYGFQITEQIKNVAAAKQKLKTEKIDLIITDMKMPGQSGVDLIAFAAENYPQIINIVLSGYRDFDYVKKSLKLGAEDYILKHELKKSKLLALLNQIKASLKESKINDNSNIFTESFLVDQRDILVQNFADKLVKGYFEDKIKPKRELELLGINFEFKKMIIALGQFDDHQILQEKYPAAKLVSLKKSFINMAAEILRENGKSFAVLKGEKYFLLLFSFTNKSELEITNNVTSAVNRIKSALKNYLNITASIAIGEIVDDPMQIKIEYEKVAELLQEKFYQGKDKIIYYNKESKNNADHFSLDIKTEKKLHNYLINQNSAALTAELENIFCKIAKYKPGLGVVKLTFISLINIVNTVIKDNRLNKDKIYPENQNPYQQLDKINTLSEFQSWLQEIYNNLIKELAAKQASNYSDLIRKTIAYLEKNYSQDITLSSTAKLVGVSYSYLSRKFKEECGLGFSDYLNDLRIKAAKKLINQGKINFKEIVNQVGFNNYNYFFKVFKDIEGITPSEYLEKN